MKKRLPAAGQDPDHSSSKIKLIKTLFKLQNYFTSSKQQCQQETENFIYLDKHRRKAENMTCFLLDKLLYNDYNQRRSCREGGIA